jgi:hypothetical protein
MANPSFKPIKLIMALDGLKKLQIDQAYANELANACAVPVEDVLKAYATEEMYRVQEQQQPTALIYILKSI